MTHHNHSAFANRFHTDLSLSSAVTLFY